MVLQHFKLREQPFGVTPDPRFLYASATHREALASVLYAIESGLGFVALTALPGMGKTTLLFEVLRLMEQATKTVFLFQTVSTPIDLVRAILIDLRVKDTQGTLVELQTQLNKVLVKHSAAGKRLVVVIDEAQNLNDSVLEAVRMLSNFETARHKLMQIVLSGQLQLAQKLTDPNLLQLRQRISIFAHLEPLNASESTAYIQHRLQVAGYDADQPLFTNRALDLITRNSGGIPRNINNICFNALSLGCALKRKTIDTDVIEEVLSDLDFETIIARPKASVPDVKLHELGALFYPFSQSIWSKFRLGSVVSVVLAIGLILAMLILNDHVPSFGVRAAKANASQAPASPAVYSAAHEVPGPPQESSVAAQQTSTDDPASKPGTRWIKVRRGQSLHRICLQSYGVCRPQLMQEIIRLNPLISDPDRIASGQRVALPARKNVTADK